MRSVNSFASEESRVRFERARRRIVAAALLLLALGAPVPAQERRAERYPMQPPSSDDLVDRRLVGLKATGFLDPLGEQPDFTGLFPARPAPVRPPGKAARYFIVQFHDPVGPEIRDRLVAAGLKLVAPLRSRAWVVRLPSGVSEDAIRGLPGIRHSEQFLPAYKLDPALYRLLAGDDEGRSAVHTLDVELFPGEGPELLLNSVAERFGTGVVRSRYVRLAGPRWPARLTWEVSVGDLAAAVQLFVEMPAVAYVRRLAPLELYNDDAVWIGQSNDRINGPAEAAEPDPKPYVESARIWGAGLTGRGQVVAVADTGLEYGTCFWNDPGRPVVPQQVAPPGELSVDPAHRKILAVNGVNPTVLDHDGSFRHGTHVAGTAVGDDLLHSATTTSAGHDHGDGLAPGAKLIFEDIGGPRDGSCESTLWVDSVGELLEQEYDAGARISTNSWGGGFDRPDEVDTVVWEREDFLVLFSAGNSGASSINDIATSKNCVAVGATENHDAAFPHPYGGLDPDNMTAFSSRGPAADGRVKPDLVAPGYYVYSNRFNTQYISDEASAECSPGDPAIDVCFPDFGGCYLSFTNEDCAVGRLLGTSMAAPVAAGLGALARQYFVDGYHPAGQAIAEDGFSPSAALLKAILLNGAQNMTGRLYERRGANPQDLGPLEDAPSNVQGWGRVLLEDALYFAGDARRLELLDVANADGLSSGETAELTFAVVDAAQPLELTLVWTDPPGASYAMVALVNDLDLVLEAPDGSLYRGNQWTGDDVGVAGDKESLRDPSAKDSLNNVEGVLLRTPGVGLYRATVVAGDVPGFQGQFTQGFALVATGALTRSPGSVPGAAGGPGAPLTLGSFASHVARFCSTGGATGIRFAPAVDSAYYLVVPRGTEREGSYGTDSAGNQRPPGEPACLPQLVGACP